MTINSTRPPVETLSLRKAPVRDARLTEISRSERESGDQVNRFLLCTLVSESAKQIKASAQRAGESIPMTVIVRAVLRSYRHAAKDKYGPFSQAEVDRDGLRDLNKRVLDDEIARQQLGRAKNPETRYASGEHPERGARIGMGKEGRDPTNT